MADVRGRLLKDRRSAEPPVEQSDALGLTAQQVYETGIEPGERQPFRQLKSDRLRFGRWGRQLDQPQFGGRGPVHLAQEIPVEVPDLAALVLPHRDAAAEALVLGQDLAAARRTRPPLMDQTGLLPAALGARLCQPIPHGSIVSDQTTLVG